MEAPLTPPGGRGEMAISHPRCARLFILHSEIGQDAARSSVCPTGACSSQRHSAKCFNFNGHRQWSRRPQPRESGGDATLRKDTRREDCRCSAQVLLVVGCLLSSYGRAARVIEHEQVEYSPKGCRAPQLFTKGHGAERRTAFPSHETQGHGAERRKHFQAMRPSVSCQTGSTQGTGGRTSGIVGMLGPWCRLTSGHPTAKGDHPQNWRATDPNNSGHHPHNWSGRRYFLTLSVSSRPVNFSAFSVSEVSAPWSTARRWSSVLCPRR